MRIKNAYVEGYLGLLEGTGRNELSVDFAPAHEAGLQRIMLFGRNGSGKSTFMNALTPFPSQGDDRSSIIVPGRAGRKVITFMRGETEVKCDIRWSSKGKTSCFMFLNGSDQPMELTAKGNIGEYLKAVEQELGVTPEFLKIGRVGSRVSGFLDLGPGPRKNYIGNFMPEVEEWAAMHKNVSKRVSAMKQQLQGLQVELDRIEPREELDNALRRGEAELARLRDEGSRLDTRIGSAQGALDEMRPTRLRIIEEAGLPPSDDYIFNPIAAAASAQEGVATRAEGQIAKLVQERPRLEAFRDPVVAKAKAAEIGNTVAGLNGQLDALRSTRLDARGRLDTAIKALRPGRRVLARTFIPQ
jgi:energy-coupling factor transporter ATP-binding protein EcfA2